MNLRWEPVPRAVGGTESQKVNFLQKRSSKIYVFAFLGPFATFLAKNERVPSPFRPDQGPTLNSSGAHIHSCSHTLLVITPAHHTTNSPSSHHTPLPQLEIDKADDRIIDHPFHFTQHLLLCFPHFPSALLHPLTSA